MTLARPADLYEPGRNCWRVERADHASVLVDCGNYYRDLYEAICKARHSIFILGWDIDSRIQLLRGDDAEQAKCPVNLFDLLQLRARENPQLMIYLNRWDYSVYLMKEREAFNVVKWRWHSPENIHYCLDSITPIGGCHHQKIVVIDDEIAFCGGMDVAMQRWDFREHYPLNDRRIDPGAVSDEPAHSYNPYHDVQCVVSGPAARALAELARERWRLGAGFEAVPTRTIQHSDALPPVWPDSDGVDFRDITIGIALTQPPLYENSGDYHVRQLYLDQIARAEKFIYMENQFFTDHDIAAALNKRLQEKPDLRVLLVSSFDPGGIMERKAMWAQRVRFRDIASDGVADRILLAHPLSRVDGVEKPVRIHSKVTIVDDRWLRIGSSNINRRSMTVDTECDLVITGDHEAARAKIAAVRTDLIREHSGLEAEKIDHWVARGAGVEKFLTYISTSRQHLRKIDDEQYRRERFVGLATWLADPKRPFLPSHLTVPYRFPELPRNVLRRILLSLLVIGVVAAMAALWQWTPLGEYTRPEKLRPILDSFAARPWAWLAVLGLFVAGGLVFFPLLALIAVTAITFGPVKGFMLALAGALCSATAGYIIGRLAGLRLSRIMIGSAADKMKQLAQKAGIVGVAALRMVPVAPFSAVNIGLGMSRMAFLPYFTGTALGLAPGIAVFAFLGGSLSKLWSGDGGAPYAELGLGVAAWIALIIGSHVIAKKWQRHKVAQREA